jgi:two-component system, chemotaxis family, CheB/CheR fusion protein
VVQSVARQTYRHAGTSDSFLEAFEQRLGSLSDAHDMLTRQNWAGADLKELAHLVLSSLENGDGRIKLDGPAVHLSPNATISFAMALTELGTNAVKHGSLSVPAGTVDFTWWSCAGTDANDGGPVLRLDWIERGGPHVVPPTTGGFGLQLLKTAIPWELGGSVTIDYREEGLVCTMEFPFDGTIRLR